MGVISTGASIYQENVSKQRRLLNTVDLEELPDSRERTGAPVLWLSCERQMDVWELFSDKSYLSAILDRQGLWVAAPVDLRTKKTESFSPQLLHGFWSKLKKKSQDCRDVPDGYHQKPDAKNKLYGKSAVCACPYQNIKFLVVNISLFWDQYQERFGG